MWETYFNVKMYAREGEKDKDFEKILLFFQFIIQFIIFSCY